MDLAEQFGIPIANVDMGNTLNPWQRSRAGLLGSDTPTEGAAFMDTLYPGGMTAGSEGYVATLPKGQNTPVLMNTPGFDPGDIPQAIGQEALPTVLGMGGGSLGAGAGTAAGPLGAFAGGVAGEGFGSAAGELFKEGLQTLAGTQRETPQEYLSRAGAAGVVGGTFRGMGDVLGGVNKRLSVSKRARQTIVNAMEGAEPAQLQAAIDELVNLGPDGVTLPKLKLMQKSENPVLKKLGDQAMQFSSKARQAMFQQASDLAKAVQSGIPGGDNLIPADRAIAYMEAQRGISGAPPRPNEPLGGGAAQTAVDTSLEGRRSVMAKKYEELGREVNRLQPYYTLDNVAERANDRIKKGFGYPGGSPTMEEIAVMDPGPKLRAINQRLANINQPMDFETVKQLRGSVGELYRVDPVVLKEGNINTGLIDQVYKDLSEVMENPKGLPDDAVEPFVALSKDASASAANYHQSYKIGPTARIVRNAEMKAPSKTWDIIRNRKELDPEFLKLVKEGDPAAVEEMQTQLVNGIMKDPNPVEAIDAIQNNPDAARFLFPNDRALAQAKQQARIFQDYKSSLAKKAEDAAFNKVGFAREALAERMKTLAPGVNSLDDQARSVVESYGGPGSQGHEALRQVVLTDILNPSLKVHEESGMTVIDPKRLSTAIEKAKESGYYNGILTERDQKMLNAAAQFARKTHHKNSTATGLAIASQIGQLRQANPMAAASIYTSARLAGLMTAENLSDIMLFKPVVLAAKGARGAGLLGNATFTTALRGSAQHYLKPMIAEYQRENANGNEGQQ
jgi:hypothetical protein